MLIIFFIGISLFAIEEWFCVECVEYKIQCANPGRYKPPVNCSEPHEIERKVCVKHYNKCLNFNEEYEKECVLCE